MLILFSLLTKMNQLIQKTLGTITHIFFVPWEHLCNIYGVQLYCTVFEDIETLLFLYKRLYFLKHFPLNLSSFAMALEPHHLTLAPYLSSLTEEKESHFRERCHFKHLRSRCKLFPSSGIKCGLSLWKHTSYTELRLLYQKWKSVATWS